MAGGIRPDPQPGIRAAERRARKVCGCGGRRAGSAAAVEDPDHVGCWYVTSLFCCAPWAGMGDDHVIPATSRLIRRRITVSVSSSLIRSIQQCRQAISDTRQSRTFTLSQRWRIEDCAPQQRWWSKLTGQLFRMCCSVLEPIENVHNVKLIGD